LLIEKVTLKAVVVNAAISRHYVGYPLGAASIASALRDAGVDVDLLDSLLRPGDLLDPCTFAAFIDGSPDLLWICAGPEALPFLALALPEVKRRHPEATIVLGERVPPLPKAAGPSAVAGELLLLCPELDAVAPGESDLTAAELARSLPFLRDIPGLARRDHGRIVPPPVRPHAGTVPEWRSLRPSAEDLRPYRELYGDSGDELYHPIAASRGCTYHCSFCSVGPLGEHRQARRPVAAVVAELERLHQEAGQRRFTFVDETFVLDRAWVVAFVTELHRRALPVTWRCTGRVDLLDRELLDLMAGAGCEAMELGIEAGSDRVLARIGKGFCVDEAIAVARMAGRAIRKVTCNFIWGYPFETVRDLGETIIVMEALDAIPSVGVKLVMLMPFRPSRLYDEYRDTLRFDRFWHRGAPAHPTLDRVLDLVEGHLQTFSGFGFYDHAELEAKRELVERTRLPADATCNGLTTSWLR
jgi:anaerobic magnesium-protoporphyrin IX monomethyl ester cyclase